MLRLPRARAPSNRAHPRKGIKRARLLRLLLLLLLLLVLPLLPVRVVVEGMRRGQSGKRKQEEERSLPRPACHLAECNATL